MGHADNKISGYLMIFGRPRFTIVYWGYEPAVHLTTIRMRAPPVILRAAVELFSKTTMAAKASTTSLFVYVHDYYFKVYCHRPFIYWPDNSAIIFVSIEIS